MKLAWSRALVLFCRIAGASRRADSLARGRNLQPAGIMGQREQPVALDRDMGPCFLPAGADPVTPDKVDIIGIAASIDDGDRQALIQGAEPSVGGKVESGVGHDAGDCLRRLRGKRRGGKDEEERKQSFHVACPFSKARNIGWDRPDIPFFDSA